MAVARKLVLRYSSVLACIAIILAVAGSFLVPNSETNSLPAETWMALNDEIQHVPSTRGVLHAETQLSKSEKRSPVSTSLSVADFGFIRETTTLEELYRRLGKPNSEFGSGNLVSRYKLSDGRTVETYWNGDHIFAVMVESELIYPVR